MALMLILYYNSSKLCFCFFVESLKKFKLEINRLFPKIYDTKLIAFEIRRTEVRALNYQSTD